MKRTIKRVGCNDFHEILACMSTIDSLKQLTRVVDSIKLSRNIYKAMLVYNNLQPHIAVLD